MRTASEHRQSRLAGPYAFAHTALSVLSGRWGHDSFPRPRHPWLGRSRAISATERGRYNISLQLTPLVRLWSGSRPSAEPLEGFALGDTAGRPNSMLFCPNCLKRCATGREPQRCRSDVLTMCAHNSILCTDGVYVRLQEE